MAKRVNIYDLDIKYETVYRDIKYPRLEFKTGNLLLVLPKSYERHDGLIEKHKDWVYKRESFIKSALRDSQEKSLDRRRTDEEFRDIVYSQVENISRKLKLKINKIYFRRMRSKWGSCSPRKNLTINTLLKYLPKNLIEYVIFHEMAHLIEKKHNERFWDTISRKFSNYQEMEKDLLVYWFSIQKLIKCPNL